MGTGKREEGVTRAWDERVFCEFRYVCSLGIYAAGEMMVVDLVVAVG